ncbi:MAG: 3,4-dihydroxy-2-butanone-4-phosphate synthase, partial [Pseudomonadota bacterium]
FTQHRLAVLRDDIGGDRAVLVAPAQDLAAEEINRALTLTGGLTFVALSPERAAAFMLSPMKRGDDSRLSLEAPGNGFEQLTSVEAREGVTTGISAADRATTIRILGAPVPAPRALVKPGHIFPVLTRSGGSLVKSSVPEAALDLVKLASFSDAALFIDLLDEQGEVISAERALAWSKIHAIPSVTISEIVRYRLLRERLVSRLTEATIPTHAAGTVRAIAYRSHIHDIEHIALVKGVIDPSAPVLVRVQVEQTVADTFGGGDPATRQQLHGALRAINTRGAGVLLYLRRGSLSHSAPFLNTSAPPSAAAALQMREYGVGAQILRDLGITKIDLLSSTNRALLGLASFGITVVSQQPIPTQNSDNLSELPKCQR